MFTGYSVTDCPGNQVYRGWLNSVVDRIAMTITIFLEHTCPDDHIQKRNNAKIAIPGDDAVPYIYSSSESEACYL